MQEESLSLQKAKRDFDALAGSLGKDDHAQFAEYVSAICSAPPQSSQSLSQTREILDRFSVLGTLMVFQVELSLVSLFTRTFAALSVITGVLLIVFSFCCCSHSPHSS